MSKSHADATDQNRSVGTVAIAWKGDHLALLDQRRLPASEEWLKYSDADGVATAIRQMVVRGAPAIGISAAYGAALEAQKLAATRSPDWPLVMSRAIETLAQSRPTAINLFWALDRVRQAMEASKDIADLADSLVKLAVRLHEEDVDANFAMADLALEAMDLEGPICVLTHCNTGALATGGYGTALGVIRRLNEEGLLERVYADETRPWLQGSRLTAWELERDGIPVTLNADSAAAWILSRRNVKWVIVGADRITANGDVANKIGTYGLAVLAKHHGVGFMVVAPASTVDLSLASGWDIPIEERDGIELKEVQGVAFASEQLETFNPVFDVTPAELIDVIVTEKGYARNPDSESVAKLV